MRQPLTDSELLSLSENGELQLILEDSPNSRAVLTVDINKPLNNNLQSSLENFVEETNKLIQAYVAQQRQELIDEIKNAMGKPKEVDPIGDPFYLEYKGYNLAIEKLTRSLNKLEESDD